MIHTGDCVEVMAVMDADSVDAIVTDPPYGLEFMGQEWDRLWGKPGQKPEGRVGSDGAFRRKTTAFSQHHATPSYEGGMTAQRWHTEWAAAALRVARPGAYLLAFGGTRTVHRMTCALEDAGWVVRDLLMWGHAQGFPKSRASLKPAWEPIVMARKPGPLRPLGIDATRIEGPVDAYSTPGSGKVGQGGVYQGGYSGEYDGAEQPHPDSPRHDARGRWPANILFDQYAAGMLDAQMQDASRFFYVAKPDGGERNQGLDGELIVTAAEITGRKEGSAGLNSPRAGKMGDSANFHPTVKPVDLMAYLIKLVTPPGGVVLDPFMGSGTTGIAAARLGFPFLGCEMSAEYLALAEKRIAAETAQGKMF